MIDNALLTHRRMYPEMFYRPYSRPYSNHAGAGWLGYIEADDGDALGFVRMDGFIVWDWEPGKQESGDEEAPNA